MKPTAIAAVLSGLLLAGLAAGFLAPVPDAAATASQGGGALVYKVHRPGLVVSITRRGRRVTEASVGAPGVCSNGEREALGAGFLIGFRRPVDLAGHFESRSGEHFRFLGRFEGDKAVGIFFESRIRDIDAEAVEPVCGNVRPRGKVQHFTAWLVEVDGHQVGHPPIWVERL